MRKTIDTLIRYGLIVDGTGAEPFEGDLSISGDRIVSVVKSGSEKKLQSGLNAKRIIDAQGLIVCPGFIDTHAHSDFTLLADPRAEGKVYQGITAEINGNCGMSAAPLYGSALERREEDLRELGIRERWATFGEYFGLLEKRGIALNFLTLAGHGNIRACVMGYENRKPTKREERKMCDLVAQSVDEGAIGLSTGLIYPPGIYSETEELIALARTLSSARKDSSTAARGRSRMSR
ncbi:MAG: amidohydrolase family protein, partial [Nitrospirota bacterium]